MIIEPTVPSIKGVLNPETGQWDITFTESDQIVPRELSRFERAVKVQHKQLMRMHRQTKRLENEQLSSTPQLV